jgi:hypothetical protein
MADLQLVPLLLGRTQARRAVRNLLLSIITCEADETPVSSDAWSGDALDDPTGRERTLLREVVAR